jgi:ribosomal protein S18 acetylase RimI-like enzyme
MSQTEYADWAERAIASYAADKVASGQWIEAQAVSLATREYAQLLPQGLSTPDHHLFTLTDDEGTCVGVLWFALTNKFNAPVAYLYNIEVNAEHRRQGHAHRALLALEDEARRLGLTGIALHVFGHNTGAQALYARLGYGPTNINLFKPLAAT